LDGPPARAGQLGGERSTEVVPRTLQKADGRRLLQLQKQAATTWLAAQQLA
jgi:hypothetical protein